MEASAAGLAAGGEGNASEGDQGTQGQQEAPQGDAAIAQFTEQLQSMQQAQQQQWEFLQNNPALQPAEEKPAEQPPPDLTFLDETHPNYDPEQAAQQLQQLISEQAKAGIQEAIGPLQTQLQELQSQQGADALTAEFPELAKPEVAEALVKQAEQQAQIIGQPELVSNFAFLRVLYMAGRASQLQQQQNGSADGAQAATLEGAGGASPGSGQQGAVPTGDSIAEGWSKQRSVLPF